MKTPIRDRLVPSILFNAMMHLFSSIDTFSPQRGLLFFPDLPVFVPISVNTALTKTLTYPSTEGEHTLNAAARFMTYPKL